MDRASALLATAERYRMMAGTITDQVLARRLLDYADELCSRAREQRQKDGAREAGA